MSTRRTSSGKHKGRRRGAAWLALAAIAGMVTIWVAPAEAVHDTGAFELEGDAENDAAVAGDDWDNVCHEVTVTNDPVPPDALDDQCTGVGDTTGATAVAWASEPDLNSTIFTGGGSKDPQDITEWLWKDGAGGLPDKDNLLHAFAARYSLAPDDPDCPAGDFATCELLYFGSDRFDNSGDAQQGFWFLQNEVTLAGDAGGGGTHFTGTHMDGDLLVISQFSNGGTESTINVWEWDDDCTKTDPACADDNLRILAASDDANCATVDDGDAFCGIVNPTDGTTAPWTFTDKSGNDDYLQGEFFEAGVNLSTLGLADRCFATVVSESRASTSPTATLKDFVLSSFGSCETELTTTPKDGTGGTIPDGGLVLGSDGTVTATDSAVLDVTGISTWSGTLQFFLCGPIAEPATCSTGGTQVGADIAVNQDTDQPILSEAATISSAGRYCWRADFTSATTGVPNASDSRASECFLVKAPPSVSTAQNFVPNDSATITVAGGGGDLAGSVVFKLYVGDPTLDPDCEGTAAYTSDPIDIASGTGTGTSKTVVSDNTAAYSASETFRWVVEYTSTNSNHTNATSPCGTELSSITIDNDTSAP